MKGIMKGIYFNMLNSVLKLNNDKETCFGEFGVIARKTVIHSEFGL